MTLGVTLAVAGSGATGVGARQHTPQPDPGEQHDPGSVAEGVPADEATGSPASPISMPLHGSASAAGEASAHRARAERMTRSRI